MHYIDEFGGYDIVGEVEDDFDIADAYVAAQGPGAPIMVRASCPIAPIARELMHSKPIFGGYLADPVVAGFFKSLKKAGGHITKPVKKAARSTTRAVKSAARAVKDVPGLGSAVSAAEAAGRLASAPALAAVEVAKGRRPDRVLVNQFKQQVADIREIAPYAQTVLSFVPGPGQGLSSAIGAGLALAEGRSLDQAAIAAIRSAVPGGPLATAAFDVAAAAAEGKPIHAAAINALPLPPAQKQALVAATNIVKAAAEGKPVPDAMYQQALRQLPPQMQKAIPAGLAVGQAIVKQKSLPAAARAALPAVAPSLRQIAPRAPALVRQAQQIARGRAVQQASALARKAIAQKGPSTLSRTAFPGVTNAAEKLYGNAGNALKAAQMYQKARQQGPAAIAAVQRIAQSGASPQLKRAAQQKLAQIRKGAQAMQAIQKTKAYAQQGHPVAQKNLAVLRIAEQGLARRRAMLAHKVARQKALARKMAQLRQAGMANPLAQTVRTAYQRM